MPALRLMTYNLRVAADRANEPSWEERRDAVASMIRFHAPNVAGVQEALPRMLADLDARLDAYDWVGTGRDDGADEHCALFYRPDQVDLARHDTFWLSETPSVPGSKSWGASYPRIVTWAAVSGGDRDEPLYVFNVHFDHDSARARRASARVLHAQVGAIAGGAPTVVLGDLNATPESAPYRRLTRDGDGFRDALHASAVPHHGPAATFNGFGSTVQPDGRIDYVFVRGPLRVRRHGTLTDRWNGYFPSDHCPVLAEVTDAEQPGNA